MENAVLEWYDNTYNCKPIFSKVKPELTLETSLSTGKYPWARETGDEIMSDYFKRFNVDDSKFDFIAYWPYEKGFCLIFCVLVPKKFRMLNQSL